MSASASKVLKTEPLDPKEARWTKLTKTTYTDPNAVERTWEYAERQTRPEGSDIDGVGIVAILESKDQPSRLLLQKQWRPPVNKVVIEVPAGLIDPNESAETCALRELKEETGYTGKVLSESFGVSPIMWNDPGFCTTNLRMIHVSIDTAAPENQPDALKPELEDNEFIECFSVPLTDLYAECKRLEAEGYAIDARVGTLAEGIELAKRFGLK